MTIIVWEDGKIVCIIRNLENWRAEVNSENFLIFSHEEFRIKAWKSTRVEWWTNKNLHREDGPAVTTRSNTQRWYYHGCLHREDGPAIILPGGKNEWWIHGTKQ